MERYDINNRKLYYSGVDKFRFQQPTLSCTCTDQNFVFKINLINFITPSISFDLSNSQHNPEERAVRL